MHAPVPADELLEGAAPRSVPGLVDELVAEACASGASDIHINPERDRLQVRMRIDGMLQDTRAIALESRDAVLARIKILAGLRTDEHARPQDGRFRFARGSVEADVRVATTPGFYGESAVLRLLLPSARPRTLRSLGCRHSHELMLTRALERSHGLVLATGPTGSGKTTLLYALLGLLDAATRSIVTLEDPVEYALAGVRQIPVSEDHGLSFATGLRSVLRQDPDVILVGEVRDPDTAQLAMNAGLTGHLVLSTLHASDSVASLPRLMELGADPYLVASTLECVVAQRLVRRICLACRVPGQPQERLLEQLRPSVHDTISGSETFYRGRGCSECRGTGYRGRIGIFEVLRIDAAVREAMLARTGPDPLRRIAHERGMRTLAEDGLEKARKGITTIEEISRASYA